MKSKKSLTFLAGIALLSLCACESLGNKITIEEARNIQQAIIEDSKKDPTKVYTTDMSIKGNMEKTIDEELNYHGVSVIIARRECIQTAKRHAKAKAK